MKSRIRVALTTALVLALLYVAHYAFALLNIPNDTSVIFGILLSLIIFVTAPRLFWLIWKGKKREENTTT